MVFKNKQIGWVLWFVFLIGGVSVFSAPNVSVQITEIAPIKIQDENEWLEFRLQTDQVVNLQHWKIQKNNATPVSFANIEADLQLGFGVESVNSKDVFLSGSGYILSGSGYSGTGTVISADSGSLLFRSNNEEGLMYFFLENLPFSLTDGGATVRILNENDEIMTSQTYGKTKYFTKNGQKYGSEIWNFDEQNNRFVPLVYKKEMANYPHSKGVPNLALPTKNENVEIVFSEIAPNQESQKGHDFLEMYVASALEAINLKYASIKHNGTTLYFFEQDFWVESGDFLVLEVGASGTGIIQKNTSPYLIHSAKKTGLSAGSGTYELILFSGTSWEKTEDFVCHQKRDLSQTETARVNRNAENWSGGCVEIEDLIKNESIARDLAMSDTNRRDNFFRHFNGSKGAQNQSQNNAPIPMITIQGSGRSMGAPPFSLNLTGENSTDPDGNQDLKSFEWKLNGVLFSTDVNPQNLKLEKIGSYLIVLAITDFSGEQVTKTLEIEVRPSHLGEQKVPKKPLKTVLKKKVYQPFKKTKTSSARSENDLEFFNLFLEEVDESVLVSWNASFDLLPKSSPVESFLNPSPKKKIYKKPKTKNPMVRKNLGLIFQE